MKPPTKSETTKIRQIQQVGSPFPYDKISTRANKVCIFELMFELCYFIHNFSTGQSLGKMTNANYLSTYMQSHVSNGRILSQSCPASGSAMARILAWRKGVSSNELLNQYFHGSRAAYNK